MIEYLFITTIAWRGYLYATGRRHVQLLRNTLHESAACRSRCMKIVNISRRLTAPILLMESLGFIEPLEHMALRPYAMP